ncbi:MurR/RpiR family transcriptional regulator [Virgibacillus oceani]
MEELIKRIKNLDNLSPGQKKVAKFVIDSPDQVALHSAKKVGAYSDTSETTVIRLCYALGYSGYNELQTKVRMSMWGSNSREQTLQDFQDVSHHPDIGSGFTEAVLDEEDKYRQGNQWDDAVIQEAIESINQAKQIIVIGLRTSYAPAHWLTYTLNVVRGNTNLYQGQLADPNFLATSVNKESLIIAFSFPRYTKETLHFVKAGKRNGATIIGISDHELSPLSLQSNIFLKVLTPKPTPTKGMSIIFSLLNVIVTGVIAENEAQVEQRMKTYNQSEEHLQFFWDENKD